MSESRLPDYLDQMLEAALQACSYVEGMRKEDFLADKRTQQAVILNLIIIGAFGDHHSFLKALKTNVVRPLLFPDKMMHGATNVMRRVADATRR